MIKKKHCIFKNTGSFFLATALKSIFILFFIAVILSFSSTASAETYEVYTYGGGDYLYYVLNGVAMIFQTDIVKSLVGVAAILLLISLVGRLLHEIRGNQEIYAGEGLLSMIRISLFITIALQVFSIPKADVLIIDRTRPSQTQVVQNVPHVQAFLMYASSFIGDTVGETMEDVFALPDAIRFRNQGVALGTKYTGEFMGVYPPDAYYQGYAGSYRVDLVYASLREFFMTCVFPELGNPNLNATTAGSFRALFNSPNILEDPNIVAISNNPNRLISGIKNNEPTMTCKDALPNIRSAWNDVYNEWIDDNMKIIAGRTGYEVAETLLPRDYLEQVFAYYIPGPLSSKQNIMNIATLNTLKDSMLVYVSRTENSASLAEYLSKKKTTAGWMTGARMLNSIVILLRQVFEGLVYGLSIFLPFAIVLSGGKAFVTYVKLVFWLNMWVPFYVLLNLLADVKYAHAVSDLLAQLADGSIGINFRNFEEIQEQANIVLGLVGATAWTVPALAWGVIASVGYGVSSTIQSLSSKGGAASTAASVGGEVAGVGNVSTANRSYGNESIRTTDAVSSGGIQTSNWANATAMQTAVNTVGLNSAINAMTNNTLHNFGVGAGRGNQSFNTGYTSGQMETGQAQGFQGVADRHGFASVAEMSKAFTTMDAGQKAGVISDIGKTMGLNNENAAIFAGSASGSKGAVDLMSYSDTLKEFGISGMRAAGATSQTITAASTLRGLQVMQENGLTARNYGDRHGMLKTAQAIGEIDGFHESYEQAVSNGYKGSPTQFFSDMSAINFGEGFTHAQAIRSAAQDHFHGNEQAMLAGVATMHAHQAAKEVKTAQQYGWTPERFGDYAGHLQALAGIGRAEGYQAVGDKGFINSESGKVMNEAGKFEMMRTAAGIAGFGGQDGKVNNGELYNFLQAHHGQVSLAMNDSQAKSVGLDGGGGLVNFAFDGNTGEVLLSRAERGRADSTFDITQAESGNKSMHYEVSNVMISGGTVIDKGTAFQMALGGDSKLVSQVTNPYMSEKSKEAETSVLARALGQSASDYIKRQGVSADYIKGEGGLEVGIGKKLGFFSPGGSFNIGGERRDQKTTDLMVQQYDSLIRSTLKEAGDQKLNREDTSKLLTQRISDFSNAIYGELHHNEPINFGASAPLGALKDSISIVPSPYNSDYKKKD